MFEDVVIYKSTRGGVETVKTRGKSKFSIIYKKGEMKLLENIYALYIMYLVKKRILLKD